MPIGGLELSLFLTMTEVKKALCGPLAQWSEQPAHIKQYHTEKILWILISKVLLLN